MSDVYQSLDHPKWDCKYHVVFVPKRRRKAIFGNIRRQCGPVFHALAKQWNAFTLSRNSSTGPSGS
jgi:putative transposase